ncbi:TPA: RHS domain-containing protein [Stenotrophomonas maltophilia]|nr:RHS domain-containing protein [Stenotrophomonas maltophilia]HDS1154646.1 RHS domain-containing protein [Stenotrophomonas maltophilia]HDS1167503.1 RHS domain-containing protein [Stenotrophomonas maltophilia]HDS1170649.1 RHS domain-containing protein [Stenotrophomonas maltophilia]HDS1177313.1 RHS domain-containing protein [Stenotrophomonas maltophilia]
MINGITQAGLYRILDAVVVVQCVQPEPHGEDQECTGNHRGCRRSEQGSGCQCSGIAERRGNNRIKRWRDQEYRYDPWGNLIEKRSGQGKLQSFSYDCENRLVRAETVVNGKFESTGQYRYDSLGRRVAKQAEINGEVEQKRFLWQGLRMLREETPGQSILYLYEPGSYAPLARVDQVEGEEQQLYYFHNDQIGTPLELTDSDGKIVWQVTYRSWGAVEHLSVNEIEQNLRFQGQYLDSETSLHYNTFRFYDPMLGRFITQDPVGLFGGNNLYQYAQNPQSWIDSLGLACDKWDVSSHKVNKNAVKGKKFRFRLSSCRTKKFDEGSCRRLRSCYRACYACAASGSYSFKRGGGHCF